MVYVLCYQCHQKNLMNDEKFLNKWNPKNAFFTVLGGYVLPLNASYEPVYRSIGKFSSRSFQDRPVHHCDG